LGFFQERLFPQDVERKTTLRFACRQVSSWTDKEAGAGGNCRKIITLYTREYRHVGTMYSDTQTHTVGQILGNNCWY